MVHFTNYILLGLMWEFPANISYPSTQFELILVIIRNDRKSLLLFFRADEILCIVNKLSVI